MGNSHTLLSAGIAAAFALLIAAVWASDAGTSTSLAVTGLLVLVGVGALVAALRAAEPPRDAAEEQRRRMRDTTP